MVHGLDHAWVNKQFDVHPSNLGMSALFSWDFHQRNNKSLDGDIARFLKGSLTMIIVLKVSL